MKLPDFLKPKKEGKKTFYVSSPHHGKTMVITKANSALEAICNCGITVWPEKDWENATKAAESVEWWPKIADMVDLRPQIKD